GRGGRASARGTPRAWGGEPPPPPPFWGGPRRAPPPPPPVLLGGHGPRALRRVVDYCDGWMPISVRAGDLAAGIADLRRIASEHGRDPASISISVYGVPMDRDALARLADLGVERAILALPSAEAATGLGLLARGAALVGGVG